MDDLPIEKTAFMLVRRVKTFDNDEVISPVVHPVTTEI
jgi:hypothetical protein